MIDGGINAGESAEEGVRGHPFLEGGVPLGVKGFGVGHAAPHPEDDDRVSRGLYFLVRGFLGQGGAGETGG